MTGMMGMISRLALIAAVAVAVAAGARAFSRHWLTLSGAELRAAGVEAQTVERARKMLQELAGRSMLDINVDDLRRRLEQLPGTGEALIRRRPKRLIAELRPRRPLARWADGGLVGTRGARYAGFSAAPLPIFSGAEARTAEMAEFYDSARAILAGRGLALAQLDLSEGGDWRVVLDNGVAVYLGREYPRARLRRFATHYPAVAAMYDRIETADLRYGRGFAVRGILKADAELEAETETEAEAETAEAETEFVDGSAARAGDGAVADVSLQREARR